MAIYSLLSLLFGDVRENTGRRPFCVRSVVLMMKINNHSISIPSFPIYYGFCIMYIVCVIFFFVSRPVQKHNMKSSISSKYNNNNNGNDDDVDVWSQRKLV